MNILEKIVHDCKIRLAQDKRDVPLEKIYEYNATHATDKRSFTGVLQEKVKQRSPAIIAEVKQRSPSEGQIAGKDFNPADIAESYEKSGATCLSILCERDWFGGKPQDLSKAREKTTIPLMRKDFIFDAYQIPQSKYIGADCILLILSMLDNAQAKDLEAQALEIGLDVFVEAHNAEELNRAFSMQSPLIGINNRNLGDLSVDHQRTMAFVKDMPDHKILVAESGLKTAKNIQEYLDIGVYCFLMGTVFMKSSSPGQSLIHLRKELEQ